MTCLLQESLLIYAVQSEEESEKIAEDFLQNQIDVDAFLDKYMEKRIVSIVRTFLRGGFENQYVVVVSLIKFIEENRD